MKVSLSTSNLVFVVAVVVESNVLMYHELFANLIARLATIPNLDHESVIDINVILLGQLCDIAECINRSCRWLQINDHSVAPQTRCDVMYVLSSGVGTDRELTRSLFAVKVTV